MVCNHSVQKQHKPGGDKRGGYSLNKGDFLAAACKKTKPG